MLGQGTKRLKPRLNWQLMAKAGAARARSRARVVKARSLLGQGRDSDVRKVWQ